MRRPKTITILHNTDYDDEVLATGQDVSSVLASCLAIAEGLRAAGFEVMMQGIHGLDSVRIVPALVEAKPDLIFNMCESMAGDSRNEPTIVGMLELFGLRYTGSDGLALGSCLHKPRAKDILRGRGIATPAHRVLATVADLEDPGLADLDYPWFLKLVHEDASVGITTENRVRDVTALRRRAGEMMQEFAQPVLAERFIAGREVNVTLIADVSGHPEVFPLHEIDFGGMPADRPNIVSYAAKWEEGHVEYGGTKPVPLRNVSADLVAAIERTAKGAWHALGLRDYARVDLRIDDAGQPWVIDVNPNCDISPDAGVARAAAAHGLAFPQLLERLAIAAFNRPARGMIYL